MEGILFGVLQGATEFLPVSSSGHLLLLSRLFPSLREEGFFLNLAVHGATLLSILTVFRKELPSVLKNKDLLLKTAAALLPLLVTGLFLRDFVAFLLQEPEIARQVPAPFSGEVSAAPASTALKSAALAGTALESPAAAKAAEAGAAGAWETQKQTTALGFLVTGILLSALFLKKQQPLKKGKIKEFFQTGLAEELTYGRALGVGAAQAICVLPGFSRSGITIAAGIFLGLRPKTAAFFSFLTALPAVACALVFESALQIASGGTAAALPLLKSAAPAFAAAFFSGVLSLLVLLKILCLNRLPLFGLYLVPLGIYLLI